MLFKTTKQERKILTLLAILIILGLIGLALYQDAELGRTPFQNVVNILLIAIRAGLDW